MIFILNYIKFEFLRELITMFPHKPDASCFPPGAYECQTSGFLPLMSFMTTLLTNIGFWFKSCGICSDKRKEAPANWSSSTTIGSVGFWVSCQQAQLLKWIIFSMRHALSQNAPFVQFSGSWVKSSEESSHFVGSICLFLFFFFFLGSFFLTEMGM